MKEFEVKIALEARIRIEAVNGADAARSVHEHFAPGVYAAFGDGVCGEQMLGMVYINGQPEITDEEAA